MSNKTQLQSLNAKYESLIEELRGKAVGGGGSGEDVTTETEDYTAKLAMLATAVFELEDELEGKASGGGATVETCRVRLYGMVPAGTFTITYTNSALELVTLIVNRALSLIDPMQVATNTILYSSENISELSHDETIPPTAQSELIGDNVVLVKQNVTLTYENF